MTVVLLTLLDASIVVAPTSPRITASAREYMCRGSFSCAISSMDPSTSLKLLPAMAPPEHVPSPAITHAPHIPPTTSICSDCLDLHRLCTLERNNRLRVPLNSLAACGTMFPDSCPLVVSIPPGETTVIAAMLESTLPSL